MIVNKIKEQIEQVRRKFPEVEIIFGMEISVLTVDVETILSLELPASSIFLYYVRDVSYTCWREMSSL